MPRLLLLLLSLMLLAYPFAVYFGLQYLSPRYLGLLLLILLAARFLIARGQLGADRVKSLIPVTLAGIALCLLILIFNQSSLVRLTPALINFTLLAVFCYTLYKPPSMIEYIARLGDPNLPAQAIAYTRHVTMVWCLFFLFNGAIALYTCFFTSLETWMLYNGLIAYLLMGILFAAEYCVRRQKLKVA